MVVQAQMTWTSGVYEWIFPLVSENWKKQLKGEDLFDLSHLTLISCEKQNITIMAFYSTKREHHNKHMNVCTGSIPI